jgi:hypothetical protein
MSPTLHVVATCRLTLGVRPRSIALGLGGVAEAGRVPCLPLQREASARRWGWTAPEGRTRQGSVGGGR